MATTGLNHFNITAPSELMEKTREFYEAVLNLKEGRRPDVSARGYWLYNGPDPIVHLVVPPAGDARLDGKERPVGYLDHVAFTCTGLESMIRKLEGLGIEFRLIGLPEFKQVQVFVQDPANTAVELNYMNESVPAAYQSRVMIPS